MTKNEASALISALFLTAMPASAKWLDSGVLTDTATWSHPYHLPKYSEYYAVVLEDAHPDQLLSDIEHAVLDNGGINPRLVNARPLPAGVVQTRYNLPQKGADRFVKNLLKGRDVKIFESKTYEDSDAEPAANPHELYMMEEVLSKACPKVRSQGQYGPPLAAFCLHIKTHVENHIAAYERGAGLARLLVAVTAPHVQYSPDPPLFGDAQIIGPPEPTTNNPTDPGYWNTTGEDHCSAKSEVIQITLSAKAALSVAENSQALIEKHGGHSLADGCILPTRLQPGQQPERIGAVKDYAVPDTELASLTSLLKKNGRIVYNGPLNALMWMPSTEQSSIKSKILVASLAANLPVFKEIPAFRTLVEMISGKLLGAARAYETTVGYTTVHFVFTAAP